MMRRTVLLLATTALALIAAGGIALAATFTCTTSPCNGTTENDQITGTLNPETINGQAGNDEIFARDANDTLNGEDGNDTMHGELGDDWINGGAGPDRLLGENGTDRLNGGAGDDTLDGSPSDPLTESANAYYDYYLFNPNWGNDTIIDSRGRGVIGAEAATAAAMPNLHVDLVSDPNRPEVTDGNGNTMNWENNDVNTVVTGAGDDVISQRPKMSDGMNGGAGSDTYQGYTTDPSGEDSINDPSGTADVLDLSSYNVPPKDSWRIWKNTSTGNVQTVQLWIGGAPSFCHEEFCRDVFLNNYFDNTTTDVCASGPGPGLIETIEFADDPSVDFQQVKSLLGCPTPDTTPPTVNSTSPPNSATGITSTANVSATFSEDMDASTSDGDASTIDGTTFTLTKPDGPDPDTNPDQVAGVVSYNSTTKTATLAPSSDLASDTTYTANIKGGGTGVQDLAGNALEKDYSWTFTTAASPASCTKTGTANAETISGTSGADVICAGGGNDTIKGLGGNDLLKGEAGNDKLLGGVGDDTLDGGLGSDTASYSASLTAVNASLATSSSTGEGSDTFVDEENLLGSSKADTLIGSSTNNKLTGGGGNDSEQGGLGNDTVIGSGGSDTLSGEGGADTVNSKDGVNGNDSLDGGSGTDTKVTDATEKSIVGFP